MKVLHITKGAPEGAIKTIIDNQAGSHEVTVVDLHQDKDYGKLLELVQVSDRVITW